MAYPAGIYNPRTKANKSGVVYDAAKTTVGYVEDVTKLDDEIVAVETAMGINKSGRTITLASHATPTPNGNVTDIFTITALAVDATFGAPTGTPKNGQKLIIRIKDNGTARTLAFNAIYRASSDLALPTTTIISKTLYIGFIYNDTDSKWDLIALLDNF